MVATVIDAVHPPAITLSQSEIEEIQAEIDAGLLPPDFLERHHEAVRKNVFGHDYKTDGKGAPLEQGRGSPNNQTHQSVEAFKKWGVNEPDYERNLARMEKELVASEARRKAEAESSGKRKGMSGR
jgi:hypothetical protein